MHKILIIKKARKFERIASNAAKHTLRVLYLIYRQMFSCRYQGDNYSLIFGNMIIVYNQ